MKVNEKCTGCMACYNICTTGAIEIIQNEKGFYEPNIIAGKCINCKKCKAVCPEVKKREKHNIKNVYAAWTKNKDIRKNSTSGGIFSVIATEILNEGGIVFGAIFDENFKVIHSYIKQKDDLIKLRGSKYVQSFIGNNFKKVEEFLKDGKKVLFSGTACQIAGLLNYLNKDYDNLITIDVLCHGIPSPKIFDEYLKNINSQNRKIIGINFRYKKPSWTTYSMKIDFDDGKKYIKSNQKDPFLRGFAEDYITKDICASCQYATTKRISDITIADFWGYISDEFNTRNTENGISLIIENTEKADEIIRKIKKQLVIREKSIQEAVKGNVGLKRPYSKNKLYDEFWAEYIENGYEKVSKKYFLPKKQSLKRKISLYFNNHAYIIPKKIRNKLITTRNNMKENS